MQRMHENLRHRRAQPHCCCLEDEGTVVVKVDEISFSLENIYRQYLAINVTAYSIFLTDKNFVVQAC